jgi:hypothetical protein
MNKTRKRRAKKPPQRPPRPNDKGLQGCPSIFLTLQPDVLLKLRKRARYETMKRRLANKGRGHSISPGDILRRLADEYFASVSELPDDAVGTAVRSLYE